MPIATFSSCLRVYLRRSLLTAGRLSPSASQDGRRVTTCPEYGGGGGGGGACAGRATGRASRPEVSRVWRAPRAGATPRDPVTAAARAGGGRRAAEYTAACF